MFEGRQWPVARFQNKLHRTWLAIVDGELRLTPLGEHCDFLVVAERKMTQLIKSTDHKERVGFRANGRPQQPSAAEGREAGFYFFSAEDFAECHGM